MKVVHNVFNRIIDIENLITSWKEFRIGKKDKPDVLRFERNLEDNLWELHQLLKERTYKHSPYVAFFIHDPKLRHIHKASVRDRVLHHAIVKHLNPIFEPTFINDSYSCRLDKGAHRGIVKLLSFGRQVSKNFSESCWVLKCDIKKFFASIDHKILLDILFRRIDDPDLRWLITEIVGSFRSNRTINPAEPKGLPIGNLTSQLFANVYLNEFDQFMKHELKEKRYIRYADDFVVLQSQREHTFSIIDLINNFLKDRLKIELHPNKVFVRKFSHGVDFLGYVSFPFFRLLRPKTQKRIFRKLKWRTKEYNNGFINEDSMVGSLNSYLGVLSHANSYQLSQTLKNQFWFWLNQ